MFGCHLENVSHLGINEGVIYPLHSTFGFNKLCKILGGLEGQEFRDCKCLGWIAIEMQREKCFHIFGNNLRITAVRPTKITDDITPIETFDLTPYL